MLSGELPFTGDGAVDIAMKQVSDPPPPLRDRNKLVSPALEQVVMRALAKDPALRHPSAKAMAAELRRVGAGGAASADTQQATQVISAYNRGQDTARTTVLPPPAVGRPAEPKRSALPWILVAILLAASAVIGYLVYKQLQGAGGVTVPSTLTGGTCQQARGQLTNVGLVGDCVGAKSTLAQKGTVFRTDPGAGSSISSGSHVKLFVGQGPATVKLPNLVGKSSGDAQTEINSLGLPPPTIKSVTSSKQPNGNVAYMRPAPGSVAPDTQVTLYVSNGNVRMPDVTGGLTCDQAKQKLSARTLNPACVLKSDPKIPAGQVIGVEGYQPGQQVAQHTAVTVDESSGPASVAIPNVVGKDANSARDELRLDGFRVAFTSDTTCIAAQKDIVESQTPAPGTSAKQGTWVGLTVWRYKPNDPSCQGGTTGTGTTSTTSTTTQ
jgi:serine/threonine-protein kinase